MPKQGRAFQQDIMRGENETLATGRADSVGGVLYRSASGADPSFYPQKRAAERRLGRTLTSEEFARDFYVPKSNSSVAATGTSIFDPTLTELLIRWFSVPGGAILDPFAGGSVRGIVASKIGRAYTGIDLRADQVAANEVQADVICGDEDPRPTWIVGDSLKLDDLLAADYAADFVLTCPPYGDLEVYSDDPADLSTMDYEAFRSAYFDIIARACSRLRDDRFAAIVVGDVRAPDGTYRGLPYDTVEAFRRAGLSLYNEAVLVTPLGSLPIRVGRQFGASRKMGKTHQNVYVFVKGDPKRAVEAIGDVEFGEIEGAAAEAGDRVPPEDYMPDLTPIEAAEGGVWLKRDDLWSVAGVSGGKVRTCWALSQGAVGLVTAGSRASPQVNIVAHIAARLGVPCRAHTPTGDLSPEVQSAADAGADIVQHKAGYNNVIIARARDDAAALKWTEIPFGMECEEAVTQTRRQVAEIPDGVRRIVVPVGSGMSLAGILHGMIDAGVDLPVLGVVVGARPDKRLDRYAPPDWRDRVTLVNAGVDYHDAVDATIGDVRLDPHYEAKCARFIEAGDLLWLVGIRATAL